MHVNEHLELWNLTSGKYVVTGSQTIFNVIGRLFRPDKVKQFSYSINNNPEKPIYFATSTNNGSSRLIRVGHFNIDTISIDELNERNILKLKLIMSDSQIIEIPIEFETRAFNSVKPAFKLCLSNETNPEELGQVVDGRWKISRGANNRLCLEVTEEDAGYDRIILFGTRVWTSGYRIFTQLSVSKATAVPNLVAIAFKWNPHRQGDGYSLPTEWSTMFAFYHYLLPNLRLNVGVDAQKVNGKWVGEHVLQEASYSRGKDLLFRIKRKVGLFPNWTTQLKADVLYNFELCVQPEIYQFRVWKAKKKPPSFQVCVNNPMDLLPKGSVGIIAHNCAVKVYEYQVEPLT